MTDRPAAALLLAAVALAYLNAFRGDFQFDDYNVIVLNDAVHSVGGWLDSMPGIRPLLKLSYALSWSAGWGAPGFHLVNIACHAASALLVLQLAARWADEPGRRPAAGAIPLLAALLFALHPAQTEAVTYVSGRSVSLMAVCYLGSLLAYLRGREQGSRLLAHGLSPALFAAALLVKETAWTLPLALWLWLSLRPGAGWRREFGRLRYHWGALGLVALAFLALPGYRRLLAVSLASRSLAAQLLTQIGGQFYLLTEPLLLLRTNIDPDLPVRTALDVELLVNGAILLALVAAGATQVVRRPWLGLGILWCFLHLLPTNGLLPRLDVANDRQLYLALIGPAVIAATVVRRIPRAGFRTAAAVCLVLVLTGATIRRNHAYRSEAALWEATAARSPDKARVWNNLGFAYQVAGETDAARRAYLRALTIQPDHPRARTNLEALPRRDAP